MNSLWPQEDSRAVGETRFCEGAKAVVAMLFGLSVAACATVAPKPADAIVKERAQARWDLMVQGEFDRAYEYFSPSSKAVMPASAFKSRIKPGFWKAVKVEKVECSSADRCEVKVNISYDYRGTRIETPHQETWIRDESNWWLLSK